MLVILTNIPTPYRSAFFNRLAERCAESERGFHVLYCGRTEQGRHWPFDPATMAHGHTILSGIHPRVFGTTAHLNVSVFQALRRLRPTTLVCAGAWNTPTVLLSGLVDVPCRVFWSEGHSGSVLNPNGLVAWFRRKAYQSYDAFAVPNERSASWALEQCGECRPVFSLPNAIDYNFFRHEGAEKDRARASLGINRNSRVLVQVSSLNDRKGVLPLAQAFLRIRSEVSPQAVLLMVGDGNQRAALAQLAQDSGGGLRLTGQLDPVGVRQALQAADVFVLNTKLDPNPLSPVEAAAAGLPLLVSSAAGNSPELAPFGQTILDPTNPEAGLRWALSVSSAELLNLGHGAREFAASLDADVVARRLLVDLAIV